MTALSVESLSVAFGDAIVLDDVSFEVGPGEWLTVIGPNGAGKSTLLLAIMGLVSHGGKVTVDGHHRSDLRGRELAGRVAFVPQHPMRPSGMRVFDYVLLGRTPHHSLFATESENDLDATREALVLLDLESLADRDVSSLSGGEAQRAALARAVAQRAPLVILDEPNSALDIGRQQEVMGIIDDIRRLRGLTVISTFHDLALAGQFSDRLVLLDDGRIVASGDAHDVLTEPIIESAYGASVRVVSETDGTISVTPLRRPRIAEVRR